MTISPARPPSSARRTPQAVPPSVFHPRASSDRLRLPDPALVFAERSLRLRQLAADHVLGEFLDTMSRIARAQHAVLKAHPAVPLPSPEALDHAATHGRAPLHPAEWPRAALWRRGVWRPLLDALDATLPPRARAVAERAAALDDRAVASIADDLLDGRLPHHRLPEASLVAAALQVHWTHLVTATAAAQPAGTTAFARLDDPVACPCCASPPSVCLLGVRDGRAARHAHCSLCGSEWALDAPHDCLPLPGQGCGADGCGDPACGAPGPTTVCTICVDGGTAEGHYLKALRADADGDVDPVADDLATLDVDIAAARCGLHRQGLNLLMLYADAEPVPALLASRHARGTEVRGSTGHRLHRSPRRDPTR